MPFSRCWRDRTGCKSEAVKYSHAEAPVRRCARRCWPCERSRGGSAPAAGGCYRLCDSRRSRSSDRQAERYCSGPIYCARRSECCCVRAEQCFADYERQRWHECQSYVSARCDRFDRKCNACNVSRPTKSCDVGP